MEISPHLVIIPDEDTNVNLKVESCSTNYATTRIRKEKEEGMIDIFRHPECRKDTLVMSFAWIATNLGKVSCRILISIQFCWKILRIQRYQDD